MLGAALSLREARCAAAWSTRTWADGWRTGRVGAASFRITNVVNILLASVLVLAALNGCAVNLPTNSRQLSRSHQFVKRCIQQRTDRPRFRHNAGRYFTIGADTENVVGALSAQCTHVRLRGGCCHS